MNDRMNEDFHDFPPLRLLRIVGLVILGVLAAAIFALAFGWFVMLLWNWLMPAIFGLGAISYWQAFGLVVLAKLIFGAVGGGKHMPGSRRDWKHGEWGPPRRDWRSGRSRAERWHHWREFWEQEGREAFDRFLERRQGAGEKPQGPGGPAGPGGTPA